MMKIINLKKINQNEVGDAVGINGSNLENDPVEIKKVDGSMSVDKVKKESQDNMSIPFRRENKNKKKKDLHLDGGIDLSIDSISEEMEDNTIVWFSDGEKPLGEGENVIGYWSF